jgi:hypothetical protein
MASASPSPGSEALDVPASGPRKSPGRRKSADPRVVVLRAVVLLVVVLGAVVLRVPGSPGGC